MIRNPERPAHCHECGNRLRRIIRCAICHGDTGGSDYLRSTWREKNVLSVLYFCRECVDAARNEISLELSEDDHAAIIAHLMRKEFDRMMQVADQLAEGGLVAGRGYTRSAPRILPGSA